MGLERVKHITYIVNNLVQNDSCKVKKICKVKKNLGIQGKSKIMAEDTFDKYEPKEN